MSTCSLLFIILYLINNIKGRNDKIIECVYHEFAEEYNLELFLDSTDVYAFYEPINQQFQYTWTSSTLSTKKLYDKIVGSQMKTIKSIELNATEYRIVIQLNTDPNSLVNFNFFHVNTLETINEETGGFGFAFKFEDYKYSLVHQLKEQNMITHLSYGLLPKKTNKGSFYFGGIPDDLERNYFVYKCKVTPNYITWGCSLTIITFNDLNSTSNINSFPDYFNRHYSYFQTGIRRTKAPGDFIEFITSTILKSLIESKKCIYETEIVCAVGCIQSIPKFNFVFERKLALTFDWNTLFDCAGIYCSFTIDKNDEGDEWVLGTNFIRKYGMLFDYEDESIRFYLQKDYGMLNGDIIPLSKDTHASNRKNIKLLFFFLIILLLTISGLLGWIKYTIVFKQTS